MSEIIAIAIGGALGALSRFWMNNWVDLTFSPTFPYGTLLINILGSFGIGVVFILLVEKHQMPTVLGAGLMVGFLGAFTTFSAFSLQALNLIESGRLLAALLYVGSSVIVCILAAALGMFAGRVFS